MAEIAAPSLARLQASLTRDGFAFMQAAAMRAVLAQAGSLADWDKFAASWDDLEIDTYMADRGRYRKRRHAVYAARDGASGSAILRQPHQPHFQTLEYNPLHGDIERWFAPIAPAIGEGASLRTILDFCYTLFGAMAPAVRSWHIETHQFRIEAKPGEAGRPTPEGAHRDGVDYVLVLLIRRRNIAQGTTDIQAIADRRLLGSFTLTEPFDAALVDDARVYHGVTPVEPLDPAAPAYRDVLVVTFRRA
jgi:hypothetical protein